MRSNYERHLPHQIPEKYPIFVTWNPKGAMPRKIWQMLQRERARLENLPPRTGETPKERKIREDKLIFALSDRALDCAGDGPMHLKNPAAAKIVEESILFGVPERYDLFAWCVMANHVHVVLTPHWELADVTHGIKGYTALQINRIHEARGRAFWQDESYDRWARDDDEMMLIIAYIENNPVVAGLCARPEHWSWSSARFRTAWRPGEPFVKSTSGL